MEKPLNRRRQQQGVRGSKDSRLGVVLALAAAPDVVKREAATCDRKSEVAPKREPASCAPKSEAVAAREAGSGAPKPEVSPAREDDSCAPNSEVVAAREGGSCAPKSEVAAAREGGSCAPKPEVGPATESASCDLKLEIAPEIVGGSCAPKREVAAARETRSSASKREVVAARETRSSAPKPQVVAPREAGSSSPKAEVVAAREAVSSAPKSEVVAVPEVGSSAPESEVVTAREAGSSSPKSEVVGAREVGSSAPESEVVAVTEVGSSAPESMVAPARESGSCAPDSEVVAVTEAGTSAPKAEVVMVTEEVSIAPKAEVAAVVTGGAVLKKKRGRPAKGAPKSAAAAATTPPLRQKREKEEEDVCFICFDGGSLVLCDRRGCPKAYHPACIKRDEAFFRSKAKWNCGWHICSVCQKTSHYMCYTCTYSLCKGCTKTADFACVRENKGLCGLCMRTIMLIEKPAEANKTMCEVDFDDKGSWEYLFKVYWVCLKEKLSLTLDDLLRAKNPWKGPAPISCKFETSRELHHLKDDKGSGSDNSCIDVESDYLENKNPKRQRFIWDGVSNYVGCNTQDLPDTRELTGNVCIKNQVNPNDVAVGDSTSVRVVKSEASGGALDIPSLLFSAGMEQPYNDFVNDKWHYRDPTGKVQGPFSMLQLYKWNSSGHFPPDLRIWRIDERQDNAILLTDALSGKCSKNVPLPYNSQQLSPEASATLVNKDNIQVGGRNETGTRICTDSQIVKQSDVRMVDDTCTQSNGIDESVWSNGLHSHSPSWTVAADGNNNEGQSGNFERREQSSKCEISCHDQPHSLPSTAFLEKLNENPSETLREGQGGEGKTEDNGNHGSNGTPEGQNNSGQSCQKQSDSEENSGQSSGQSWECPNIHTSMWQAIFGEPTDFSSLVDESVSDLLAEVEAMESLGGLESPTSIMKCDEELTGDPKEMTLEFALGISPMRDAGKGDSLSSTADLHLPSQPTAAEEPFRHADVHNHHQRIPGEQASNSSEVEVGTMNLGVFGNQWNSRLRDHIH